MLNAYDILGVDMQYYLLSSRFISRYGIQIIKYSLTNLKYKIDELCHLCDKTSEVQITMKQSMLISS